MYLFVKEIIWWNKDQFRQTHDLDHITLILRCLQISQLSEEKI